MRRLSEEGGAVALFTALCMMMLAAFAAFAVNSGLVYDERRQLQNGADAAAFAIAFDCARGTAVKCTHTYATTVSGPAYADSNARDGDATIQAVEPAGLAPDSGEVTVETLSREGAQDAVTLFMGNVLGRSTAQVRATATARWGGAGTGTGLPLAIPLHRWEAVAAWQKAAYPLLTNAQGLFPEDGPFPLLPAPQTVFSLGGVPDYPPGSFGWIDHPQNVHPYCQVSLDVDDFAVGTGSAFGCNHPDASGTSQERAAFLDYAQSRTHPLPVFDSHDQTGGNARYDIYSWAGIRLTGYRFTGAYTWGSPCPSGNCIRGWLSAFDPSAGPIGGPDTGLKRVQLVD
ncbi:MAG: pilus assembly protein TadG-related protein [Egibacteraceae bacterium]